MKEIEQATRPKAFVSYSRQDSAFVDELVISLESYEFDVVLDREDLFPGEPWEPRLRALISEADTTVCVVSQGWLASDECIKELNIASEEGRRIIPLIIDPTNPADMPDDLARLQFVFFHGEGHSYARGVVTLIEALRTDISWVRQQSRLLDRAHEWTRAGKAEALLLRGPALTDALDWLAEPAPERTHVAPLVAEYVSASQEALREDERRRTRGMIRNWALTAVAAMAILGAAAAWLAFEWQHQITERKLAEAEAELAQAELQLADLELVNLELDAADAQSPQYRQYSGQVRQPIRSPASRSPSRRTQSRSPASPSPSAPAEEPSAEAPVYKRVPEAAPAPAPSAELTLVQQMNDADRQARISAGAEVADLVRDANNDAVLEALTAQIQPGRLETLRPSGLFNMLYMLNLEPDWTTEPSANALKTGLAAVQAQKPGPQTADCVDKLLAKLSGERGVGERCGGVGG